MTQEYELTRADFSRIKTLMSQRTGIELGDDKKSLVYARLVRRLRHLRMSRFAQYCDYLEANPDEIHHAIGVITTHFTSFFREKHHFDVLQNQAIGQWTTPGHDREVRIWSAGCSTGEEAYSIAMTLDATLPVGWRYTVLGTDVDAHSVATAKEGIYRTASAQKIPWAWRRRYLLAGRGQQAGKIRIGERIRPRVRFATHNLFAPNPHIESCHAIFCRNVAIYFEPARQQQLFKRLSEKLTVGGYLFIGHAETIRGGTNLQSQGKTIYRRVR